MYLQLYLEAADVDASNGTIHIVDAVIGLPSIVDHAVANSNFGSLVAALGSENLVTTLEGAGPFTVLAPTDDAFASFTNPSANALSSILLNHVLGGATTSTALTGLGNAYTVTSATGPGGFPLSLYFNTDEGVRFNGVSSVSTADIVGTNGIIHAVDAVIDLPTIVTHAVANPDFDTLQAALTDLTPTDYASVLGSNDADNDASPFTVFAPTNGAFDDLLMDLGLDNATEIPTATLEATLNLHVLTDLNVRAADLGGLDGASVPTFGGPSITIDAGTPAIIDPDGGSNPIIATDVQAVNGVIHAVSRVIRDL